jgi:hypothetical protein
MTKSKLQINSKYRIPKADWKLEFGYYLGFDACNLGFKA